MKLKRRGFLGGFNRFRLMLTLGLAVVLPAAALIYLNFSQLRAFQRDKVLEAAFQQDFQEMLAITEKKVNKKAYTMTEEARDLFPSPDLDSQEKEKKLDLILAKSPWLSHVFFCDEKGFLFRSQPQQMDDKYFKEEHQHMGETFHGWYTTEGKTWVQSIHKRGRPIFYTGPTKRAEGDAYIASAMFVLPQVAKDRVVLVGVTFDPNYLK